MRLTICLLMAAALIALAVTAPSPVRCQEGQGDTATGPIDAAAEIAVRGKRRLPGARARLVLPDDSGLKFSSMSEKEVELGDLEPGSSAKVTWNLEGRSSGSSAATVVVTSSHPGYDHIPGTYSAEMGISVSTQRTWLVLILLSVLILLILGMVLLSMRKHRRASGQSP